VRLREIRNGTQIDDRCEFGKLSSTSTQVFDNILVNAFYCLAVTKTIFKR